VRIATSSAGVVVPDGAAEGIGVRWDVLEVEVLLLLFRGFPRE
jgi:hypothetical protein